eukprot:1747200-Prymnesium_polylepis.1
MDEWKFGRMQRTPSWPSQFATCGTRYMLKLMRTRRRLNLQYMVLLSAGMICGFMHGPKPDQDLAIVILTVTLSSFSCLVAISTIATFGATSGEVEFFKHEAASGVGASAEAAARITVDVFAVLPMALLFALPVDGITASYAGTLNFVVLYSAVGWTYSSIGYACAVQ